MNIPRPTARPTILAALATAILVCLFVGIVPATRSARKSISSRADAANASTSTSTAVASSASVLVDEEPYVRLLQLSAKDLAVDPVTQTIYASVPSTAGASGNSIVAVNPSTGALAPPIFVGSDPNQLAVTDDGRYVYVVLDGAGAVRRFDTQTQTAGPQYTLGNDSFDGPLFGLSLSLAPGSADTFAVFRLAKAGGFSGNGAVFDGGVRREKTFALAENSAWVAFGATASRLYSFAPLPGRFTKLNAAPDGLTSAGGFTFNNPSEIQPTNFIATQDRVHFAKDLIAVPEGDNYVTISVTRVGDATGPASVDYETVAGTASDRSDFTAVSGTLFFAPNETAKTVEILLNDDAIVEGSESFTLRLKNPTGAVLDAPAIIAVSIADNDSVEPTANPLQDATYFVRQHYHDFLNREPDAAGLAFWVSQLNACNALQDPRAKGACLEDRRVNVSAAFFLSIEFQQTGYLVHRFYTASFPASAARPAGLPRLAEFLRDTQEIGRGVVVGAQGWEQQLEANKRAFALAWVQRPEFLVEFPESMDAEAYINKLFSNSGVTPTPAEFNIAFDAYNNGGVEGRANVLRSVADSGSVYNRQYNSAVVLMQYIGYLRRNPNDAPDSDLAGYNFWLAKLNEFSLPGEDVRDDQTAARRIRRAEMVRAFLVSLEYEQRFGPANFDIRK